METKNFVARLNECKVNSNWDLRYEDVEAVGPAHSKTFTVKVVVDGKDYPHGVGRSKKEAKQKAAENALKIIEESHKLTESVAEDSTAQVGKPRVAQDNCIGWLNEYGQRNQVTVKPVELTKLGPNQAMQCCYFMVGDKEYPAATGRTKKEAKEEAARLACAVIQKPMLSSQTMDEVNESVLESSSKSTMNMTETDEGFLEINFIGRINDYCQRSKLTFDYVLVDKRGPAHDLRFYYKLVINNKDYAVGEGRSATKAKQNAAQRAWYALQELSDRNSKVSYGSDVSPTGLLSKPEFCELNPDATPGATSESIVFTDSPEPLKMPIQNPVVKAKRRLAPSFNNVNNSMEEPLHFKGTPRESSESDKIKSLAASSRFMLDFDSIEWLGSGAFGGVYKAQRKLEKKYYAVKIVRWKEKSLREVNALSELLHCNIVRYYTCWLEDSGYQLDNSTNSSSSSQSSIDSSKFLYMQMELCDTMTLRVWIDEKNFQNAKNSQKDSKRRDEGLNIVEQIVSGVEYIHGKNLIHRDLKPANILFGQDGTIKIGDFGLVTIESEDAESMVERTVYKGTPSYMAPEQKSRRSYDRQVDVFALGLIFFELLWRITTSHERKVIWNDVRNQKLPREFLCHFPFESDTIKSMLHAKPEDRPEARKLKEDLEEYMDRLTNKSDDRKTV
ncbi:interferon-induced, double-stranded RNA-activated protein kinase-like [Antennarius striatus]|uniref:interferon-induced, double-stranded RNA-activated protein kinase-like n=1 Tax=Antennarius striatus TaxID=241820 RepID=UPI0035B005A4